MKECLYLIYFKGSCNVMFAELFFIFLAIFVVSLIDIFSTLFGLVACVLAVCCYVYTFSYIFDQQVIVRIITKIWTILLIFFRICSRTYGILKGLFSARNDVPSPSQSNIPYSGDIGSVGNAINLLVTAISRYYINSWYGKISSDEEFLVYLNCCIRETLLNLCKSISKVDRKKFSYVVLQVYLNFFSHFIEAKKKCDIFKRRNFEMKHWAMRDNLSEWCYLQSLVGTLLDSFCPPEYLHSKYGPVLHTVVVEILTENLINPLVNVLCNPSHLNKMLLKVLMNYTNGNENVFNKFSELSNSVPSKQLSYNSNPTILLPDEDISNDCVFENNLEIETKNSLSDSEECSSFPVKEVIQNFVVEEFCLKKLSEELPFFVSPEKKSSSNLNLHDHEYADLKNPDFNRCSITSDATIKRSRSADFIQQMPRLKALNEKDYSIVMQSDNNKMLVALKSDTSSINGIEQAEEAIEVEVPTLFTDVKIVDTFQQGEAGLAPYTLYCIQYAGIFHDTGKSSDIPLFVKQVITIKRRFREFVSLHSRLEDNLSLKTYLKGIKGPSKWLVLPFSNLDKKNIAERKAFLENYLKELCNSAAIAQSAELQEFLAYGGDNRMTFIRKNADGSVPRIDRMLVRGVKGAFDIIKTALPYSPLDGENPFPTRMCEETVPIITDQTFREHLLDYSSRVPKIREHILNFMENPSFKFTVDDWDSQEILSEKSSPSKSIYIKAPECCRCPVLGDNFLEEEYPFGNIIIELFVVALKLHETNLGDFFSFLKVLSAPCINRFFIDQLDNISDGQLTNLLHTLHKFLWPDERITKEQEVQLEVSQIPIKIMEYAEVILSSHYVMQKLNRSIQSSVLEKLNLFLLSIQHQEANKCLLFHLFDVVIETLCSKES